MFIFSFTLFYFQMAFRKLVTVVILLALPSNLQAQSTSDGPYLFQEADQWISYQIRDSSLSSSILPENRLDIKLEVATDQPGEKFEVYLKPGLGYELAVYEMPENLVAISDIEGNFGPFRKLLQAGQVIDENYNWTFGDGHLVLTGDFFDRGEMVTQVLWLIYKLEWEAYEAGGQVHFILGNHETMNLQGDLRYVNPKHKESAKLMERDLIDLYGDNTELGQWLRTKNIIEKIGDHLFVHAGISGKVNKLGFSIAEINSTARPFLDWEFYHDHDVATIMSTSVGPLWYRGYYQGAKKDQLIDETCKQYNISKIITDHTVVADNISTHYDGRVINIDTRHREGFSEALLIEEGKYYAIDTAGNKRPLFLFPEGG